MITSWLRSAKVFVGSETVHPAYGLHLYQRQVLNDALSALGGGPRRTVLHMPTGAGKTRVACHAACHLLRQSGGDGALIVWLASTEELCAQAADDLARAWSHLGDRPARIHRFWGSQDLADLSNLESGFLVAGMQKLYAAANRDVVLMRDIAENVAGVIFDEAHQAVARTYEYLAEQLATYQPPLLGLTATPGRTADLDDDLDYRLADMFGNSKVTIDPRGYGNPVTYLIRQEFLADPRFDLIRLDSGLRVNEPDARADYAQSDLNRIGENEEWREAIVKATQNALRRFSRVLVFAPSVDSAKECADAVGQGGQRASTILATTPDDERREIIETFKSGDGDRMALFNYGVLTAGFDAPKTRCVVIARPTKSLVLYSQMCGRAMRGPKSGGNRSCRIYTVVDTSLPGFGSVTEAFTNWETLWQQE